MGAFVLSMGIWLLSSHLGRGDFAPEYHGGGGASHRTWPVAVKRVKNEALRLVKSSVVKTFTNEDENTTRAVRVVEEVRVLGNMHRACRHRP
ncbi:hypothetical protein F5B18DRAFT_30247 [Nemania serpens]|nr:hypothetical protein F5B18DRAFT_30247 [Nemania serpens]